MGLSLSILLPVIRVMCARLCVSPARSRERNVSSRLFRRCKELCLVSCINFLTSSLLGRKAVNAICFSLCFILMFLLCVFVYPPRDLVNGTSYGHAFFTSVKRFAWRVPQTVDEFLTPTQSGKCAVCLSRLFQRDVRNHAHTLQSGCSLLTTLSRSLSHAMLLLRKGASYPGGGSRERRRAQLAIVAHVSAHSPSIYKRRQYVVRCIVRIRISYMYVYIYIFFYGRVEYTKEHQKVNDRVE